MKENRDRGELSVGTYSTMVRLPLHTSLPGSLPCHPALSHFCLRVPPSFSGSPAAPPSDGTIVSSESLTHSIISSLCFVITLLPSSTVTLLSQASLYSESHPTPSSLPPPSALPVTRPSDGH